MLGRRNLHRSQRLNSLTAHLASLLSAELISLLSSSRHAFCVAAVTVGPSLCEVALNCYRSSELLLWYLFVHWPLVFTDSRQNASRVDLRLTQHCLAMKKKKKRKYCLIEQS